MSTGKESMGICFCCIGHGIFWMSRSNSLLYKEENENIGKIEEVLIRIDKLGYNTQMNKQKF